MNSSWFKIILILSLGLNCLVAGALIHRFVWGRPLHQVFGGPPPGGPERLFSALPQKNIAAHEQLREKMMLQRQKINAAKQSLVELLAAPAPERGRIEEQLGIVNRLHADMERLTVEQMLEDIQSLPPEKRASFVEEIKQSMYCRRGDGPGLGRGPEGCGPEGRGGWRHRPKDFHP